MTLIDEPRDWPPRPSLPATGERAEAIDMRTLERLCVNLLWAIGIGAALTAVLSAMYFGAFHAAVARQFSAASWLYGLSTMLGPAADVIAVIEYVLKAIWTYVAFDNLSRLTGRPVDPIRSTLLINIPFVRIFAILPVLTNLWAMSRDPYGRSGIGLERGLVVAGLWVCTCFGDLLLAAQAVRFWGAHVGNYNALIYGSTAVYYAFATIAALFTIMVIVGITRAQVAANGAAAA